MYEILSGAKVTSVHYNSIKPTPSTRPKLVIIHHHLLLLHQHHNQEPPPSPQQERTRHERRPTPYLAIDNFADRVVPLGLALLVSPKGAAHKNHNGNSSGGLDVDAGRRQRLEFGLISKSQCARGPRKYKFQRTRAGVAHRHGKTRPVALFVNFSQREHASKAVDGATNTHERHHALPTTQPHPNAPKKKLK